MAQTVSNVSAAKPKIGGAIFIADTSATMPTSAATSLGTGWSALGYVSSDGLTNSNSPNTSGVTAWGGDEVITLYNEKTDTFNFKLLEVLNVDVLKAVYGESNVSGTLQTGITINANNKEVPAKAYCFDMVMRNGALKRIVVPTANVTSVGDITYKDSDTVAYDTTISAHPDASGNTHYEYISSATGATGANG